MGRSVNFSYKKSLVLIARLFKGNTFIKGCLKYLLCLFKESFIFLFHLGLPVEMSISLISRGFWKQFEDKVILLHHLELSMTQMPLFDLAHPKTSIQIKVCFPLSTYINRKQIHSSEPITSHTTAQPIRTPDTAWNQPAKSFDDSTGFLANGILERRACFVGCLLPLDVKLEGNPRYGICSGE